MARMRVASGRRRWWRSSRPAEASELPAEDAVGLTRFAFQLRAGCGLRGEDGRDALIRREVRSTRPKTPKPRLRDILSRRKQWWKRSAERNRRDKGAVRDSRVGGAPHQVVGQGDRAAGSAVSQGAERERRTVREGGVVQRAGGGGYGGDAGGVSAGVGRIRRQAADGVGLAPWSSRQRNPRASLDSGRTRPGVPLSAARWNADLKEFYRDSRGKVKKVAGR